MLKKFILKINKDQKGQSSIEFIMTFAFAIGICFLFVSHAINMTTGFLAHYATFMSGRAFLTYDATSNTVGTNMNSAERIAKKVFNIYRLDRFGLPSSIKVYKPKPAGQNSPLFSGVTVTFQKRLTPYKLVGGAVKATMMSEGFLGKEPLKIQCWEQTCRAMGIGKCLEQGEMDITVYDNGC